MTVPRVWVLAACEGMVSLFEKRGDGHLTLLRQGESSIAPSAEHLRDYMVESVKNGQCNQLVLVGSGNDIAWAQALVPEAITHRIIAEIEYPLLPGWFRETPDMKALSQALEQVFKA